MFTGIAPNRSAIPTDTWKPESVSAVEARAGPIAADPSGHRRQRSLDLGAAWLLTRNLQLDGGVNLGLDRQTPDVQGYAGISQRF